MSKPNNSQLADIVSYMAESMTVPQVVSHYDKSNVFSTIEQRVGIYANGRPIYKRTWTGLSVSVNPQVSTWVLFSDIVVPNASLIDAVFLMNSQMIVTPQEVWIRPATGVLETLYWPENRTIDTVMLWYTKTTDSAVDYTISSTDDYSTSETLIGRWFDGNDLFQRTYSFTMPSTQGNHDIVTLPTGSNVKDMQGGCLWNTNCFIPLSYVSEIGNQNFFCFMFVNEGKINIGVHDADLLSKPAWITVKYTKA